MIYAQRALESKLIADTLTGITVSGSSTTMLQLGAGLAAAWLGVEWVNLITDGKRRVARVSSVDTTNHQIYLDRALSSAPAAGVTIGGGYVEWVYPATSNTANDSLIYRPTRDALHPAVAVLATPYEPRCIVILGPIVARPEAFTAGEERHRFRVLSKVDDWANACAARVVKVLHGNRSGLTVPGRYVYSVAASDVIVQPRDTDEFAERHVRLAIVTAEAA